MPDVPPWARVAGDVNVGVRRGAWYQVVRLTPDAAWLDVFQRTRSVPRDSLEIVTVGIALRRVPALQSPRGVARASRRDAVPGMQARLSPARRLVLKAATEPPAE